MNNADWWAKKLGNPQPQQGRPDPTPPMPPSQLPMSKMPAFPNPGLASPNSKAQSLQNTATCPDCGSGNYFSATPQTSPRCYDCGYPIQQSGSRFGGLAGAHVEGTAKPAQGNSPAGGYNPQTIVGRLA